MNSEADFAFKQAFAICPSSFESVYRYVQFLVQRAQFEEMSGIADKANHYFDDAILVAETCKRLDPYNDYVPGLISQVKASQSQNSEYAQMETMARTNPGNVQTWYACRRLYAKAADQSCGRTV